MAIKGNSRHGRGLLNEIGEDGEELGGPALNGVIGRKAGTYPGQNHSDAKMDSGLTWDEATFRQYIKDPKAKCREQK